MNNRRVHGSLAAGLLLAAACLAGTEARAQGDCLIDGPTSVAVQQPFTLCGPGRGGDFDYQWRGSGVRTTRSGCVDIAGLPAGEYQYELITYRDGVESERCVHTVRVGSGNTGSLQCQISGPRTVMAGASVTLCAGSTSSMHTFEWSGPGGELGSGRCLNVTRPGDYELTIRNRLTGYTRTCTHQVEGRGTGWEPGGDVNECGIDGPQVVEPGRSVRLCADFATGWSYRWTAPNGAAVASRCMTATLPGTYDLTMRHAGTGTVRQCSHVVHRPGDDPDGPMSMNCPQPTQFWRQQCPAGAVGRARVLSTQTLREIARRVDERSRYFNWTNDVDGLCRALSPSAPMTWRKDLARQAATLLANVAAGELNVIGGIRPVQFRGGDAGIGLDADTHVNFRGARTIQGLIRLTDDLLLARTGDFNTATQYLTNVNRGVGIGPTCD